MPAADAGQGLDLVEQQGFQLERGDVAEQGDDLERLRLAIAELRHRGHREPGITAERGAVDADHGRVDDAAFRQRPVRRQCGRLDRLAVLVDEAPVADVERVGAQLRLAHAEHAFRRRVGRTHATVAVVHQDALVDGVQQFAIAPFRVAQLALGGVARADVAGHGDDAHLLAVEEHARVHLDREIVAVGVAIGGLHGFRAPDLEGPEHPFHVVVGQARIEVLHAHPAQLGERMAIDRLGGLVGFQDAAEAIMHGHRLGHGVEQGAVPRLQCVAGAQQGFDAFAGTPQGQGRRLVHGERGDGVRQARDRILPGLLHRRLGGRRIASGVGLHVGPGLP